MKGYVNTSFYYLTFLFTIWAIETPAAGAELTAKQNELIEAAETAFTNGHYEKAIKHYETLVEQAPSDPALLYNLGTAHVRAGRRGPAIWRYLQALRLRPRDHDLLTNLTLIAPPTLFHDLALTPIPPINWLYRTLTANEWAMTAVAASMIAMILGALACWRSRGTRLRAFLLRVTWTFALLALVTYPFALSHYFIEEMTWQGVIVAENTVAHTGPSENQIQTFKLPEGRVVRILETTKPGWLKVSFAGGSVGFIQRDRVRFL